MSTKKTASKKVTTSVPTKQTDIEIIKVDDTPEQNIKSWVEKYPNYKVDLKILKLHESYEEFSEMPVHLENIEKLNTYLSYCLEVTQGKVNIFPYPDLLYNALNTTPLNEIKVVILGQDPYFNPGQAMGLSFSVMKDIAIPPSLMNIYKNLLKYKHMNIMPNHGNLTFWAQQGCLLLNTTLTVQAKCPNGHEDKWKDSTDALIKFISDKTEHVVFMIWGAPSLKKRDLIDETKHKVIVSSHPSPLSAQNKLRQYDSFMDTDHFGQGNKYLTDNGKTEIVWQIA